MSSVNNNIENYKNTRHRSKVLVVSYAFPPLQVQMSHVVFKFMAALSQIGYQVDLICADKFSKEIPDDKSLLKYESQYFSHVWRLNPRVTRDTIFRKIWKKFKFKPDLMSELNAELYSFLAKIDLDEYDAVISWSPFHSINLVLTRLKRSNPKFRWIAIFGDPWTGNPLEKNKARNLWNAYHEPKAVGAVDEIVHTSSYSMELMALKYGQNIVNKLSVMPHAYVPQLYPQRQKKINDKIVLRYVGVLYGRRSPEPLFSALAELFNRRPDLKGTVVLELVGDMPKEMLYSSAARELPNGCIKHVQAVEYLKSLELMYDADILVLIEADVRSNLFLASKVADYLGANTPIIGLVPQGASEDIMTRLGSWFCRPNEIFKISNHLESAIDHVSDKRGNDWCDEDYRREFNALNVIKKLDYIIKEPVK